MVRRNAAINRIEHFDAKVFKEAFAEIHSGTCDTAKPAQPAITDVEKKSDAGSKQARVIAVLRVRDTPSKETRS